MGRSIVAIVMGLVLVATGTVAWWMVRRPSPVMAWRDSSESPRPPDPGRGRQVFLAVGCLDCHSVAALPQVRGTLGPPLDGLVSRAALRRPGMSAEAYIRESIERPAAYVPRGYLNAMPSDFQARMSRQEFDDLVAWLLTLR